MKIEFRLKYGDNIINYTLFHQERKSLSISVNPNKSVEVKAPSNATITQIEKRLLKRAPWVIKQINFFEKLHPLTPPRKYLSGETHLYLGRQYKLKIRKSLKPGIKIQAGYIVARVHPQNDQQQIIKIIEDWYKARARQVITKLYEDIIAESNLTKLIPRSFQLRKMSKRWGSCTPSKKIIINTELIKAPKNCIRYVIIHELCHLQYPNHSKKFYRLLSSLFPNWEFWKNKLEFLMS